MGRSLVLQVQCFKLSASSSVLGERFVEVQEHSRSERPRRGVLRRRVSRQAGQFLAVAGQRRQFVLVAILIVAAAQLERAVVIELQPTGIEFERSAVVRLRQQSGFARTVGRDGTSERQRV